VNYEEELARSVPTVLREAELLYSGGDRLMLDSTRSNARRE
jgi:hypothetical protein